MKRVINHFADATSYLPVAGRIVVLSTLILIVVLALTLFVGVIVQGAPNF